MPFSQPKHKNFLETNAPTYFTAAAVTKQSFIKSALGFLKKALAEQHEVCNTFLGVGAKHLIIFYYLSLSVCVCVCVCVSVCVRVRVRVYTYIFMKYVTYNFNLYISLYV